MSRGRLSVHAPGIDMLKAQPQPPPPSICLQLDHSPVWDPEEPEAPPGAVDRALEAEGRTHLQDDVVTAAPLGRIPVMAVLGHEAGSTSYTVVGREQQLMEVANNYCRSLFDSTSRVLELTTSPSPSMTTPGSLSLFFSHVPTLHLAGDAEREGGSASDLPQPRLAWFVKSLQQHRVSSLISGFTDDVDSVGASDGPVVINWAGIQKARLCDLRSVSLGIIRPSKVPLSSDLSSIPTFLATERVFAAESASWTLSSGTGALPRPTATCWTNAKEDAGRLTHFHWEPPALMAKVVTDAEMVLSLSASMEYQEDATSLVREGFVLSDTGRVEPDEKTATRPVPRGGTERWSLFQLFPETQEVHPSLIRNLTGPRHLSLERAQVEVVKALDRAVELTLGRSDIHSDTALVEVGLNSMRAEQLRNAIQRSTVGGASIQRRLPQLPATLTFDYPTKAAIADFLIGAVTTRNPRKESPNRISRRRPKFTGDLRVKYEEILRYTRSVVKGLFGDNVFDDTPLLSAGINSVGTSELRNLLQLKARNNMDLPQIVLPATVAFDYPTTALLAGFLFSNFIDDGKANANNVATVADEASDLEAEGNATWCIARAKKRLQRERKATSFSQLSFAHLSEVPLIEAAMPQLINWNNLRSLKAAAGDLDAETRSVLGEEAIKQISAGGYVKGEGRLFVAYSVRPQLPPVPSAVKGEFLRELKKHEEYDPFRFDVRPPAVRLSELNKKPAQPVARYFIAGSWSAWKEMQEMATTNNEMYVLAVGLRPGHMEEFQILADGLWNRVFYPPPGPTCEHSAETLGPISSEVAHGRNFFIQVPDSVPGTDDTILCVIVFSPELKRVHWHVRGIEESFKSSTYYAHVNKPEDPRVPALSMASQRFVRELLSSGDRSSSSGARAADFKPKLGFFLNGNWDGWVGFTALRPLEGEPKAFKAQVTVKSSSPTVFQVVADRDLSLRFTPRKQALHKLPLTGGKTVGITGPSEEPAFQWILKVPKNRKTLTATFRPQGECWTLLWEFS